MSDCGLYGIDPKKPLPTTSFYRLIVDDETILCKSERQVHPVDEETMICKECGMKLPEET